MKTRKQGFTLAELLIVVAIIAVLVAVAIPVFGGQVEKSKQAVDMSNMRAAYAVLLADYLSGDAKADTTYYYDSADSTLLTSPPAQGYGQSTTDAVLWWTGAGTVEKGIPNVDGVAKPLSLSINEDGEVTFRWSGSATMGYSQAKAQDTYLSTYSLSQEERTKIDNSLFDAIQTNIHNMTYRQLKETLVKEGFTGGDDLLLAKSAINNTESSPGKGTIARTSDNIIYAKSLFDQAGFDSSVSSDKLYLVNSVQNEAHTINIKLKLNKSLWNMNDAELDKTIGQRDAVVYLDAMNDPGKEKDIAAGMTYNQRKEHYLQTVGNP